jgi:hypothetical protein
MPEMSMVKIPTEDEQYFAYREEIQFHLDLFNKYAEYLYLSSKPAPTGIQFVLTAPYEATQRMVCILPNRSPVMVSYQRVQRISSGIPTNDEIEDVLSEQSTPPKITVGAKQIVPFAGAMLCLCVIAIAAGSLKLGVILLVIGLIACFALGVLQRDEEIHRPNFFVSDLTEASLGQARSLEELKALCPIIKGLSMGIIRYIRENVPKQYHESMQLPPREISDIQKDSKWNPFV